jgi:hypothetical protein
LVGGGAWHDEGELVLAVVVVASSELSLGRFKLGCLLVTMSDDDESESLGDEVAEEDEVRFGEVELLLLMR